MRRRVFALVLGLLTLAGAACGSDPPPSSDADDGGASSPLGPPAPSPGELERPRVEVPDRPPPQELRIEDLVVGTGPTVRAGQTAVVHYVGVSYSTGEEFDASWDRGQPFPATLVSPGLIDGWVEGIPGMRVGGRRELIIPPELAYGAEGNPAAGIGPNETLIFVVDLLAIQ